MSYCIRPRQDFSLATFSRIMKVLFENHIEVAYTLAIDPDTKRCESRICIDTDIPYDEAVGIICTGAECIPDNFKLKAVKE